MTRIIDDRIPAAAAELRAESRTLRAAAESAARSVGDGLRDAFRSGMEVAFKRDARDVVTVHDRETERAIAASLLAAVPDSELLGEEGGSVGSGRVKWYVDPIDGTSNFAIGFAFWCVSIAAAVDGRVVAGVVFDPISGELFAADLDGAELDGAPLHARGATTEAEATLITGYPNARQLSERTMALDRFGRLVEAYRAVRRPGSAALSIAHVAAGRVDAAAGFSVNPWDVSAAGFILVQAGGHYRAVGGDPNVAWNLRPGYVATVDGLASPTLDRVADEVAGPSARG